MRRFVPLFGFASALALATPSLVHGQLPPRPADPDLMEPYLAWDRGEYLQALDGYLGALRAGGGEARVAEVARLTGEPFRVKEVAPDGQGIALAPDGSLLTWSVAIDGVPRIGMADAGGDMLGTVAADAVVPGPDRSLALFRVEADEGVRAAERRLGEARATRERDAIVAAARELVVARARATRLSIAVAGGDERTVDLGGLAAAFMAWSRDGDLWVGTVPEGSDAALLRVRDGVVFERIALGRPANAVLPAGAGRVVVELAGGQLGIVRDGRLDRTVPGRDPSVALDGSTVAYLADVEGGHEVRVLDLHGSGAPRALRRTDRALANPAASPDGRHVVWQERVVHDEELFVAPADGSAEAWQLTWEIQHDLFPAWIDAGTVIAAKGEGRHRRSFLYRLDGTPPLKLFHNNTVRTIAPEYEWLVSPDGSAVWIVSERDGDTVSPERGVYRVDLRAPVTRDEVVARLQAQRAAEADLRRRGHEMFEPLAEQTRRITEQVDVTRIYLNARDLYQMGSKYITQPGNATAVDYYVERLREYGYEPELQWFEPRPGVRTANVIARLEGTRDPELVYVVSSHFDSVERGPGADDDTSGGTALLEAARVMRDHPQPTTIEFAFFTGEEAGLLGSREYVRLAVESGKAIVGALNNDMIGWANDHRLDNTIRYSNPGIRDVQHAAAMQFGGLITYDALYYKNTDAHAYYEAYGDIVGGIGSYPVLGNPHYHQFTDRLETIDQRLVAAVSKTTVATLVLLANVPARLKGLVATRAGDTIDLRWQAAPESDVTAHLVRWIHPDGETGELRFDAETPRGTLPAHPAGTRIGVKAVNGRGMAGWDWAWTVIE